MTRELLGELEHRVLLATARLGAEAYSVPVALYLEEKTGREVALATIQVVLRRLEEKELLASELRNAPPDEGGRERRYYAMTGEAWARLRDAREELLGLWQGLESLTEGEA